MNSNTFDESNLEASVDYEEYLYAPKKKKTRKQSIDDYYRDMEIERIIARQEGLNCYTSENIMCSFRGDVAYRKSRAS